MTADKRTDGAYVAYSEDFTHLAVFSSEVQALRYAVDAGLKVKRVPFGVEVREAVKANDAATQTETKANVGVSSTPRTATE